MQETAACELIKLKIGTLKMVAGQMMEWEMGASGAEYELVRNSNVGASQNLTTMTPQH